MEQTLFFSRLRRQAKWVFVFLALSFGIGFVIFGVGSDIGGGLSDIFRSSGGSSSSSPSVEKALKETEQHPKRAQAWRALGEAYEADGKVDPAIGAWTTFTKLRPKGIEGFTQLATLYEQKANRERSAAQLAQAVAQAALTTNFTVPASTPLGRALAERPDAIAQAVSATANARFNEVYAAYLATLTNLVKVYERRAALQPDESAFQLQLADAAEKAGDPRTAIAAYKRFLKLAPDAPEAPGARERIKTLQSQLASLPE